MHIRLRLLMGLLRFRKLRGHKIHKQPPNGDKKHPTLPTQFLNVFGDGLLEKLSEVTV